ncbi:hypothetical protein KMAL_30580 [Novacetimonas maltaceti]|uniref:Uncharacterized protein n=1 Tax=Novacetimonas maltaceti TaxID=1203393 RepID=A0A2S3VXK1_9PROT|nr:hypothetical protein KMAL_30580 [Novacetimonas maltaceti]
MLTPVCEPSTAWQNMGYWRPAKLVSTSDKLVLTLDSAR